MIQKCHTKAIKKNRKKPYLKQYLMSQIKPCDQNIFKVFNDKTTIFMVAEVRLYVRERSWNRTGTWSIWHNYDFLNIFYINNWRWLRTYGTFPFLQIPFRRNFWLELKLKVWETSLGKWLSGNDFRRNVFRGSGFRRNVRDSEDLLLDII